MSKLTDILNQLPELGFELNPPASQDQIDYLQAHLGIISDPQTMFELELPEDILELYRHHNGMPYHHRHKLFDMRLMSIEEAIVFNYLLEWTENPTPREDCCFFWVNGTSPAGGIYIAGKLKGEIFIWNPEDEDWSPRFRSIESLYRHGLNFAQLVKQKEENPDQLILVPKWQLTHTDYP